MNASKTVFGSFLLLGTFVAAAGAQPPSAIHFSGHAGLNLATLSVSDLPDEEDTKMRPGLRLGGMVDYDVAPTVSVGGGLLFNMKGADWEWDYGPEDRGEGTTKLSYLSIPAMATVSFGAAGASAVMPFVTAGPQLSFLLSADHDGEDIKDELKSTEFGVVFGGGVMFPLGGVTGMAQVGYDLGLTDIGEDQDLPEGVEDISEKTRTLFVQVGVRK